MPRTLDILFFVMMILACIGVDFTIMKFDKNETSLTVSSYIEKRKTDINYFLNPPKLIDLLPNKVTGWQISISQSDQPIILNGQDLSGQQNEITLIKTIAHLYRTNYPSGEFVHIAMSRENVGLRLYLFSPNTSGPTTNTTATNSSSGEATLWSFLNTVSDVEKIFTVVDGFNFIELPINTILNDPDLRLMRAEVGNNLIVFVVTKSIADPAIDQALNQFDLSKINAFLPKAKSAPAQGSGFALPQSQPDNQTPANIAAPPEPAPQVAQPAESTAPTPEQKPSQPCVRRAGVLVCPEN